METEQNHLSKIFNTIAVYSFFLSGKSLQPTNRQRKKLRRKLGEWKINHIRKKERIKEKLSKAWFLYNRTDRPGRPIARNSEQPIRAIIWRDDWGDRCDRTLLYPGDRVKFMCDHMETTPGDSSDWEDRNLSH